MARFDTSVLEVTREILQSNCFAVSNLKILRFGTIDTYLVMRTRGAKKLVKAWKKRGIEVICERGAMMDGW